MCIDFMISLNLEVIINVCEQCIHHPSLKLNLYWYLELLKAVTPPLQLWLSICVGLFNPLELPWYAFEYVNEVVISINTMSINKPCCQRENETFCKVNVISTLPLLSSMDFQANLCEG